MDVNNRTRLIFLIALAFVAAHSSIARGQCSFSGLQDSYDSSDEPVQLSGAPSGGLFVGAGIRGNAFDPAAAGPGTHTITYTDTSGYSVSSSGEFAPRRVDNSWRTVRARSGGELEDKDDDLSPAIDIGFDFHFFGESYNRLYVSSNGEVVFTPYNANAWRTTFLPSRAVPNNMIALARTDLEAGSPIKSSIRYRTIGSAPNRVFLLNFDYEDPRGSNDDEEDRDDDRWFDPEVETQLKLYETSQAIEIHTRENRTYWQASVQGIENRDGTRAYYVFGRNYGIWFDRTNDYVSFRGCSTSQTVTVDGAYSVGGSVSGLEEGNDVVLRINGGEDLEIDSNGRFTFDRDFEDGERFEVTVLRQPTTPEQTCTIANGSGTITEVAVNDVTVSCAAAVHSLSYRAGANGSILGETDQTVEHGEDASEVTAMPDPGYQFVSWSDGSTENPRQEIDVDRRLWVEAEFVADAAPSDPDQPNRDRVAPVISGVSGLTAFATGLLTDASGLGPEAVDNVDGPVPVTIVGDRTLLRPGRHFITWAAEDSAGNRAEAQRRLDVYPIISLTRNQSQPEGGQAQVQFILNGQAPRYPLTVGYTIGGSASADDYRASSGAVTFAEGQLEQTLTIDIVEDDVDDAGETIEVVLNAASTTEGAANFGRMDSHTITIKEGNLAPAVDISIFQDGQRTQLVNKTGGAVLAVASVRDPNPDDSHSYDWDYPPTMPAEELDPFTLRIDPSELELGSHTIAVTATEEGTAPLSVSDSESFLMTESSPELSSQEDSDGDGRSDRAEGYSDQDGDSQPDHLDAFPLSHVLGSHAKDGFLYLVETEPGLRFELGNVALRYGADGAGLDQAEVGEDEDHSLGADSVANTGGYVDFELRGLPIGGSANIVLPQYQPIPENPVYRKYMNEVWSDLDESGGDTVASAPGNPGACPPPGSDSYQTGLTPGHWCVQLTLSDGGLNDADGLENGIITDPGGVGAYAGPNQISTSGGGGSWGAWSLLLLFAACVRSILTSPSRHRWLPASVCLLVVLVVPARGNAVELLTTYYPLYIQGSLGLANTSISNSDLDARFAAEGYDVQTNSSDGSRYGWSLGLGVRATDRFMVELDYIDLGEVEVDFQSESTGRGLARVYPESGHGGALSVLYRFPLTERVGVSARAGGFIWDGEYSTSQESEWIGDDGRSHKDIFYGVGADYILSPSWSISGELQRFELEDPAHFLSVGFEFRFLEWLSRR